MTSSEATVKSRAPNPFQFPTFCFITGASRGIGRGLALEVAKKLTAGSVILLSARNEKGLQETSQLISESQSLTKVYTFVIDLVLINDCAKLKTCLTGFFGANKIDLSTFEQLLIFHNAGTLGDVSQLQLQLDNSAAIDEHWHVNLTAVILINKSIFDLFSSTNLKQVMVVNISSLAAVLPSKSMSLYCPSKAARDMLFKVLSVENPHFRVLNYAPGPVRSDMQKDLITNTCDSSLAEHLNLNEEKLLTPEFTAGKLMKLLEDNAFDSGAHIDVYDLMDLNKNVK